MTPVAVRGGVRRWAGRLTVLAVLVLGAVWGVAQTQSWLLSLSTTVTRQGSAVTTLIAGTDYQNNLLDQTTPSPENASLNFAVGIGAASGTDETVLAQQGAVSFDFGLTSNLTLTEVVGKPSSWSQLTRSDGLLSLRSDRADPRPSGNWMPGIKTAVATASGGGDGFVPILVKDPVTGRKRIFTIFHRTLDGKATQGIHCIDFTTGLKCDNSYPKAITSGSVTYNTPLLVHAELIENRIYFPAMIPNSQVGVGCWDTVKHGVCTAPHAAFMPLTTTWAAGYKNGELSGVRRIPSQPDWLFLVYWGELFCVNLRTKGPCDGDGGQWAVTFKSADGGPTGFARGDATKAATDIRVAGTPEAPDSMVFVTVNGHLSCLDVRQWPATVCHGSSKWPLKVRLGMIEGFNPLYIQINTLSQVLDAGGTVIGVCSTVGPDWGFYSTRTECYDTRGTRLPVPGVLAEAVINGDPDWNVKNRPPRATRNYHGVFGSTALGSRVYYALPRKSGLDEALAWKTQYGPDMGAFDGLGTTACWDFATNSACSAFVDGGTSNAMTGFRRWNRGNPGTQSDGGAGFIGETKDYGYIVDPDEPSCLYGLGDGGLVWSFSAKTGVSPCTSAVGIDRVLPDPTPFCASDTTQSRWSQVVLRNLPSGDKRVTAATVELYDASLCPDTELNLAGTACTAARIGSASKEWPGADRPASAEVLTLAAGNAGLTMKARGNNAVRFVVRFTYTGESAQDVPTDWQNFRYELGYTALDGRFGEVCLKAKVGNCPGPRLDALASIRRQSDGVLIGSSLTTLSTNDALRAASDVAPAVNLTTTQSGRVLYRALYRSVDWSGDLAAYRTTDGMPEDTTVWASTQYGMASERLPAHSDRTLLTALPTAQPPGRLFTASTFEAAEMAAVRETFGKTVSARRNLIDYLRGDRSLEADRTNGRFRPRMLWTRDSAVRAALGDKADSLTALGAFVKSEPVYAGGMVYAQAADGMLHAFDANSGVERFAYVPRAVYAGLPATSEIGYRYAPLMEGQVAVAPILVPGSQAGTYESRTVLVASTGGLYPAVYSLDVSDPTRSTLGADIVRFESTHDALGQANGRITITQLDDKPIALLGNGVGSRTGLARLIQVDLRTGALTAVAVSTDNDADAFQPNGLSAPTPLIVDGQLVAVYAGDARGNLWRFPVVNKAIGTGQRVFAGSPDRPISAAPTVSDFLSIANGGSGHLVLFGTGRPLERSDFQYDVSTAAEQAVQAVYGLLDEVYPGSNAPGSLGIPANRIYLREWDSLQPDQLSSTQVPIGAKAAYQGWMIPLRPGSPGTAVKTGAERVLNPVLYDRATRAIHLVTAVPRRNDCVDATLDTSSAIVASALDGRQSDTLRFTSDAFRNRSRIQIYGTLGGVVTTVGAGGSRNYTSNLNAQSGIAASTISPAFSSALIHGYSLTSGGTPLRRSSWLQLF